MRGHVHKRGSSWSVVYDEGTSDNGKRRQRTKGGFATRKQAQGFLIAQLQRLGDGSYAAPSKLTLGDYLTREWLPAIENTVRPGSYAAYERLVRLHISPNIGGLRLQGLSGGALNGLYHQLDQQGLGNSAIRGVHAS